MAAEFKGAKEVVKIAKPADLIEINRGIYKHWTIYIGDGDIVNFGSDSTGSLLTQDKSLIKREKLTEVAGSDLCRVNNRLDHTYPPRDPKLVVRDALQMVGQEVPYSVLTWNCEHFVTGLRYYKPESGQVEHVTYATLAVSAILLLGATLVASLREKDEESDKTEKKEEQKKQKV